MKKLIIILLSCVSLSYADAVDEKRGINTADDLKRFIHGSSNDKLLSVGYVDGVASLYMSLQGAAGAADVAVCLPKNFTLGQAMDLVEESLNTHESKLNMDASLFVVMSLYEKYPCKK